MANKKTTSTKKATSTKSNAQGNKKAVSKVYSGTHTTLTIAQVKPQIMQVKRQLHKHLKAQGLNAPSSTPTKPVLASNATPQQATAVQKKALVFTNALAPKHSVQVVTAVKNHMQNNHAPKYLTAQAPQK